MTNLENSVLSQIATSEYNSLNGEIPSTPEESITYLWVDEIADALNLTMPQVKGVLSNLVKKGIIAITEDSEDNLVKILQKGIDIINEELNDEFPNGYFEQGREIP